MVEIYAQLPSKKKVRHGRLEYGIFTRIIPHEYIRHSDKAFCINANILPELQRRGCQVFQFIWVKAKEKVVYRIDFDVAIHSCKITTNEYGEENLRIPIAECRIINRISRIPEEPQEPIEKEKQQLLF